MRSRLVVPLVALGLVAAACGGAGANTGGASNQVVISGSSTVEPISALNAERFDAIRAGVAISVDGPGTSDGFVLFCEGQTDISDASRAITQTEIDTCRENGVEPIELKVAIDGLSVLTSAANGAVDCLDFGDLYALLGAESIGFDSWSDANPLAAELDQAGLGGSHAPYPDAPLVITAPGEESGTFDSFVEIVLEGIADERGQDPEPRPDYVASPNDNVIIEGITGTETSLGWVGYAFYLENQDVVKALEVDGGDGCVAPTPETIAAGEYPISRPLFIYVNAARAEEKQVVAEYVDYYLSDEGLEAVDDTGYVRLADEEYAETRDRWENRTVVTEAGE